MSTTPALVNESDPSKWDDKFDRIVKWYNDDRPDTDPKKTRLPAALQEQLNRWQWVYDFLNIPKNRYKRDSDIIKIIKKQYPDLSERTARFTLRDMRRFFGVQDQPQVAFEKVMLIASMKDTLRRAKIKNDTKGAAAAEKNLMSVLGADRQEEMVENKTIINVINFNPESLGAIPMTPEKLDELIAKMLGEDKKKADQPFDDFEDVTDPA